jgi:hypothetical protein
MYTGVTALSGAADSSFRYTPQREAAGRRCGLFVRPSQVLGHIVGEWNRKVFQPGQRWARREQAQGVIFASANLYEATFQPKRIIDRQ